MELTFICVNQVENCKMIISSSSEKQCTHLQNKGSIKQQPKISTYII